MSTSNNSAFNFPKKYQVPEFVSKKINQGLRGTCVAFSVVALLNYLFRKQNKKFSTQYLYTRCKQEDQNTNDGTNIENAFKCIQKYGICQEKIWLYDINETEKCIDENILSKLPIESCADVNFQMLPSPRNVDELKKILCGAIGNIPMPIVFGCSTFTSGCRENWLQEPVPGDKSEEGHAILLYGWKDTPGLCSRGYFLAQNSLLTNGDNGSGELRIPFEYIEKYGLAAGTVICETEITGIACNTESDIVAAEVESNSRNTIMQMDCQKAKISAIESNFFSTIRENIQKAPYFYPDLHMPFFNSLQINQVNVEKVLSTEENCTNDFKRTLIANNISITKNVSIVLYWFKINSHSCWCLSCAFFTAQQDESITQEDIKILQNYIKESCGCRPDVKHFFFTLGTNTKFLSVCNVSSNPTVLLCEYKENNLWTHRVPMFECDQVGDEFLAHIMPGQYKEKIEEIIHRWQKEDGHIREQEILTKLGFESENLDLTTVRIALDDIVANGGYAIKKSGEIIPYKLWGRMPPPDAKKIYRYTTPIKKLKIIQCLLSYGIKILKVFRIIPLLFAILVVVIDISTQVLDKNFSFQTTTLCFKWESTKTPLSFVAIGIISQTILYIFCEIHYKIKLKYNLNF